MTRATILFADNDPEYRNLMAELLQHAGYEVITASGVEEARQILSEQLVDIAVLDLRLTDDLDETDLSGLTLAKSSTPTVPKILNSKYPSIAAAKEALGLELRGLPAVTDFVAKSEGIEVLLASISKGLEGSARLKAKGVHALRIEFKELMSLRDWARKLKGKPSSEEEMEGWVADMEELLGRLLIGFENVILDNIELPRADEARAWASVFATDDSHPRRLLKLWTLDNALRELRASYREVTRYQQLGDWVFRPDSEGWDSCKYFGGAVYLPNDSEKEPYLWLEEYVRHRNTEKIQQVVVDIFRKAESRLYVLPVEPSTENTLPHAYARMIGLKSQSTSRESLQATIDGIRRLMPMIYRIACDLDTKTGDLSFSFADIGDKHGLNPIHLLRHESLGQGVQVLRRLCIGSMDGYNILVDLEGNTKLTDLSALSEGPSLSDFVALEARFRFDWAQIDNARQLWESLSTLLGFADNFGQAISEQPVAYADQVLSGYPQIIHTIRHLAQRQQDFSASDYYVGLFYHASSRFIQSDDPEKKIHALTAASILAKAILPGEFATNGQRNIAAE